jgi:hypothetical protein
VHGLRVDLPERRKHRSTVYSLLMHSSVDVVEQPVANVDGFACCFSDGLPTVSLLRDFAVYIVVSIERIERA